MNPLALLHTNAEALLERVHSNRTKRVVRVSRTWRLDPLRMGTRSGFKKVGNNIYHDSYHIRADSKLVATIVRISPRDFWRIIDNRGQVVANRRDFASIKTLAMQTYERE